MANALNGGTQAQPNGETVAEEVENNAGSEQDNDAEQHHGEHEDDADEGKTEGQEGDDAGEGAGDEEQQEPEKPKKKALSWEMKRIHEETNKRREAERELERLRADNERLRKGEQQEQQSDHSQDDDARVDQRARQIVQQNEYQARVNAWDAAGAEEFGRDDFNHSCNVIASLMDDHQQAAFMAAVTDPDIVEDGHKVIMALAEDPEEAERILRLPPVKQALALNKIAAKAGKTEAPAPKQISKVPAPVKPIGGSKQETSRLDDPNVSMDAFAAEFNNMMANRKR